MIPCAFFVKSVALRRDRIRTRRVCGSYQQCAISRDVDSIVQREPLMSIPPDNPNRHLTLVQADDPSLPHVAIVGDTYTVLVSGKDTDARYCLIDMLVADGGGPASHRHNFEEMFTILDGEIEIAFRGETQVASAGMTINIPANAPHAFRNVSGRSARLLCMCTPAGQDEFFLTIGTAVASRSAAAPEMNEAARAAFMVKAQQLAPQYETELLPPSAAHNA
jgi:quercetin dioxygenase-like cupin family protein